MEKVILKILHLNKQKKWPVADIFTFIALQQRTKDMDPTHHPIHNKNCTN